MKILLTGGGSGGHFYPLIAVARALYKVAEFEHIPKLELFFMADNPVNEGELEAAEIKFIKVPAGKMRRYFSFLNLLDLFKTFLGIVLSFFRVYSLMPDVVFGKGGYASFPVLLAGRILKIPVIIHESDSVPGAVNSWAGKWAKKVLLSFGESARFFDAKKTMVIGNPIRSAAVGGNLSEAIKEFNLEEKVPVILILGGSQGSEKINEAILDILPKMVEKYQIIHQTGPKNFEDVEKRSKVVLLNSPLKHRYHVFPFFSEGLLKNASRAASLVLARSGSTIFEIAAWELPSILIPLPTSAQNHQRENAYNYAKTGACEVVEENNLTPHILLAQIDKILENEEKVNLMKEAAKLFAKPNAADIAAQEIIKLGTHD